MDAPFDALNANLNYSFFFSLLQIQVIVGVVSAAARPDATITLENPYANNVPELLDSSRVPDLTAEPKEMIKKHLSKRSITCNDASPSG